MTENNTQIQGSTPVPNQLLETMAKSHLSGVEMGAVLFLLRSTLGWAVEGNSKQRRTSDKITLAEWVKALDTDKAYIARVLASLVSKKIIIREPLGTGKGYVYSLNLAVDQWDNSCVKGQQLSNTTTQQLCKSTTLQLCKRTTPLDTDLASPKESIKESLNKGVHTPLKIIKQPSIPFKILTEIQKYLGYPEKTDINPIPYPEKEMNFIKKMTSRGFTEEEILACAKGKIDERGCFVSMLWVGEDIGKPSYSKKDKGGGGGRVGDWHGDPKDDPYRLLGTDETEADRHRVRSGS